MTAEVAAVLNARLDAELRRSYVLDAIDLLRDAGDRLDDLISSEHGVADDLDRARSAVNRARFDAAAASNLLGRAGYGPVTVAGGVPLAGSVRDQLGRLDGTLRTVQDQADRLSTSLLDETLLSVAAELSRLAGEVEHHWRTE